MHRLGSVHEIGQFGRPSSHWRSMATPTRARPKRRCRLSVKSLQNICEPARSENDCLGPEACMVRGLTGVRWWSAIPSGLTALSEAPPFTLSPTDDPKQCSNGECEASLLD